MCECETGVQSLHHVLFTCQSTDAIRQRNSVASNLAEFFDDLGNAKKLRMIEKLLKLVIVSFCVLILFIFTFVAIVVFWTKIKNNRSIAQTNAISATT